LILKKVNAELVLKLLQLITAACVWKNSWPKIKRFLFKFKHMEILQMESLQQVCKASQCNSKQK